MYCIIKCKKKKIARFTQVNKNISMIYTTKTCKIIGTPLKTGLNNIFEGYMSAQKPSKT